MRTSFADAAVPITETRRHFVHSGEGVSRDVLPNILVRCSLMCRRLTMLGPEFMMNRGTTVGVIQLALIAWFVQDQDGFVVANFRSEAQIESPLVLLPSKE